MGGAVDLHSHTTASDGTLGPAELVREAVRRGVRVLAVTDHDSTEGLAEAMAEAARHPPLQIVPGIEINCDIEGAEIHILGYCMAYETPWFQDFCHRQREERRARVHRMADRLAELGMPIDPEAVFAIVREGSAGRPHVAQVMLARGYVKTVREAFDKYLGSGKPAHVPRVKLTPADAVRLIRKAGGVPVIAHPGLADRDELIPDLVAAGLWGSSPTTPSTRRRRRPVTCKCAGIWGLVPTGGSDFHGPRVRAGSLGVPSIPMVVWEELKAKAAEAQATRQEG